MKTQSISVVSLSDRSGSRGTETLATNDMETALCEAIAGFQEKYMGRRPQKVDAFLRGNVLLVRVQGVLTKAEKELAQVSPGENGLILLKELRKTLIETSRSLIEAMVQTVAGAQVRSMHHDVSTITGEEVLIFTLDESADLLYSGFALKRPTG